MEDRIDALSDWAWPSEGISPELLATTRDSVLDEIVETAAVDLQTPIAMVTILLDRIQLLRAARGLPEDLLEVGATDRAASFCQFVVRDKAPFAVGDAVRDERVPQYLVTHYGLRSYYGVPVRVGGQVIGSLCVIDTQPRDFDDEQRSRLFELGRLVDSRLAEFKANAERHRASPRAVRLDALRELRDCVRTSLQDTAKALVAGAELKVVLQALERVARGRSLPKEAVEHAASSASEALEVIHDSLFNLRASIGDAADVTDALHSEADVAPRPLLSEVAIAGRELARRSAADVGGIRLPPIDPSRDVPLGVPRGFGVLLVAQILQSLARELLEVGEPSGIGLASRATDERVSLTFETRLEPERLAAVVESAQGVLAGEPGVQLSVADRRVRLELPIATP